MIKLHSLLLPLLWAAAIAAPAREIVSTPAYAWVEDTIAQGPYRAWAPSDTSIVSTYAAQPHYFMPVDKEWRLRNDISAYPRLSSSSRLHQALYNMALDEMVNAVEPDTTLRTGKEWAGVWTRDVSYSIILSMAYMQPLAAEISLRHKVTPDGRIVQDTGSGGAWPVSTDREVWVIAAWELYKVTGSRPWLEYAYPIAARSLADDRASVYAPDGLVRGETSFIDWREQSHPRWMQTADVFMTEAMNTNMVHAIALDCASQMAAALGKKKDAAQLASQARALRDAINATFWMDDKGYYGMYLYGRDNLILNPRAETLGESLAILYDIASPSRARAITEHSPVTPYGAPIFYPQIADMPAYHNNALWPWVASMWALANAKAGNEEGTLQAIGSVFRPAALFATNKENLNLDNGDIATELNSSNMLWCLSGNIALTTRILFGIHYEPGGLRFAPFIPRALADTRTLAGFPYRGATLDITVSGYGDSIRSFKLNGREHAPFIPAGIRGANRIDIVMADTFAHDLKVNATPNAKAPLTPIAALTHSPELYTDGQPLLNLLAWQPIEYIDHYVILRDGAPIAQTTQTTYPATRRGEYQVIGVSAEGIPSFASAPADNRDIITVEMPAETPSLASPEVSYAPRDGEITGYHGSGFAEVDHSTAPITLTVNAPADGEYALDLVYANGNGPVNTENKCAIRTILVNGARAGITVMPQRGVGNWSDWGLSSPVRAHLREGQNTITITFTPDNENMNIATNHAAIDRLRVKNLNN